MPTPQRLLAIGRIDSPPAGIELLGQEDAGAGGGHLTGLVEDWESGESDFSRPEEAFFEVRVGDRLIGLGGISVDPSSTQGSTAGRIRHLYILEEMRRSGVGSALLQVILAHADGNFRRVRLRCDDEAVARWADARGFSPIESADGTTYERLLGAGQNLVFE